jgi:PhzF family phenazine biosynthesis protein
MERRFNIVDVFTSKPFKGNPLAVVLDAEGLDTQTMQAIANWTNLSETTFVQPPTDARADYRVRIFTPRSELPFAGHPTLGTAWTLLESGLTTKTPGQIVQECGAGFVRLRQHDGELMLRVPDPSISELSDNLCRTVVECLGIESQAIRHAAVVNVGPVWITVQLPNAEAVLALQPRFDAFAPFGHQKITGITVFGFSGNRPGSTVEVRSFAPTDGVNEDPVCGSGNGCVAALIRARELLPTTTYVAAQGRCVGRDGTVRVEFSDTDIWIGGRAITCSRGVLTA